MERRERQPGGRGESVGGAACLTARRRREELARHRVGARAAGAGGRRVRLDGRLHDVLRRAGEGGRNHRVGRRVLGARAQSVRALRGARMEYDRSAPSDQTGAEEQRVTRRRPRHPRNVVQQHDCLHEHVHRDTNVDQEGDLQDDPRRQQTKTQ